MDFEFNEEQKRFRQEVRDFLEEEIRKGTFEPRCDNWIQGFSVEFTKKVAARDWIGLSWPRQYGGQGRSQVDRFILTEEMLRYGAPCACHWFADRQIGAAIMAFGNDEQKKELLPKILRGEAYVGLGMSEPEAGSDLASLKTKATEQGDYYIIDGQKMWTSCARFMNYVYLVARTDPNVPKRQGISEFVIDVSLPGITIRPTIDITGSEAWGEVFYDGVRVPKKYLIGQKNRGFYQIMHQLDFERAGVERLMGNFALYDSLVKFVKETKWDGKPLAKDTLVRQKLAQLEIELEVGRLLTYRVASVIDQGRAPNWEAAEAKAFSTTFEQKLAAVATDILGPYGQLLEGSKYVPFLGMAPHSYLGSKGYSLQGGTTEVLRNIVAMRGLGLPQQA